MASALATLAEAGAHFVLCGENKRPKAEAWQKTPAPLDVAERHIARGLVGAVPASLGCVVVDVDEGGDAARDAMVALLGAPLAVVPTRRDGGWHLWYRSRDAAEIGNAKWRDGAMRGDVRGAKGYAILWHPDLVAEGLADTTRLVANLVASEIAALPAAGGAVGERNDTLNRGVFLATRNGAPIEPVVEAAREAGLPEGEIAATVASAATAGKRAGAREMVPNARSPEGLAFCLDKLGVGLRLNTRAKKYEYEIGGEWVIADDEETAKLRGTIAKRFSARSGSNEAMPLKYSAEMFLDLRAALGADLRRDPFLDWLDTLPAWDGVPRIDGLLTDLFGADPSPLVKWASRYIGIGAVQRAFEPGAKLDEVPILFGEQGTGKSAFVRAWFDDDQHEWHGDAVDLGARAKEQAEQLAGRVVCELSELAGIRKAELERLKSFITRQDDGQFRWAYARAPVASPRRVVFVGTTNEGECLPNDPSGNRRFVVIELKHGCDVQGASVGRVQWWCEALARYHAGERANLPRDLIGDAAAVAEAHRSRDTMEDAITEALVDLGDEFTIGALHDAVNGFEARPPDKAMQMRLSVALRNLGFRRVRVRRHGIQQWLWSRG